MNNPRTPQGTFTRDLMSSSLPKMPPRVLPALNHTPSKSLDLEFPSSKESGANVISDDPADGIPKTNPMNPLQAESVISVGLMRVADRVARKVLPWQAVLCPRAVESLGELRLSFMQTRHTTFMISMKNKLEEKVSSFLQKKETEVDSWIEKEVTDWQRFLAADETDLGDFLQQDLQRITHRAVQQDIAYRQRELAMANEMDDHERDQTREMLNNFRRIVRSSKPPVASTANSSTTAGTVAKKGAFDLASGGTQPADKKQVNVEVRVLQDNIARAQNVTTRKLKDMVRTNIRKQEECHDWLCSLADNAITASVAEVQLHALYGQLDFERQKSLDSLHSAMLTYQEQHNAILEAIVVFAGRIHQHASDYLQREQLINRAFTNYLLGIISGEIKSNTQDQKKNSYAWETKSVLDRGVKKEQMLVNDFNHHIAPLDRMVQDFKDKMRIQLEHITMKLQAVVNGKENDVNARKALIHKKLAKHVNKSCNARRQRLKDATAVRRDEFELEALAVAKADDLTGDLRAAVDSIWVKEHLRERRIFEASLGRLERLEKTALIIWNKHAYLAVDIKEDYEDWLETYKKDRDDKVTHRKEVFERDNYDWRVVFGKQFKSLAVHLRKSFNYLIPHCYEYDVEVPIEKNLEDIEEIFEMHRAEVMDDLQHVRGTLEEYLGMEMQHMDKFTNEMRSGLLQEWKENLVRLDGAVNRRIGGLKDMEADLEETIRLTILQHEVEANVFEQLSCSRLETFWIEWQQKMNTLAKDLIQSNEDYEIAKLGGKAKARASQKDRQLDDMVNVAKDSGAITAAGKKSAQSAPAETKRVEAEVTGTVEEADDTTGSANSDPIGAYQNKDLLLDTKRMKVVLEDIKPDIYRDFTHKLTRGLEKVRRDLGEGRQRLVPPFAATKVLFKCCHRFFEQAKLSERCIGRISSRGVLLFSEGLPMHAQATFSIAASLALVAQLAMRDNKIDCDDIFSLAENMKVYFMVGMLTVIHSQFNEFGDYFIKSEIIWMCSVLEIVPPADILYNMDCKGLREQIPKDIILTGIFSDDPVDLLNSIIDLPTDLNTVQRLTKEYELQCAHELAMNQAAHAAVDVQSLDASAPQATIMSDDVNLNQAYNKAPQENTAAVLDNKLPATFLLGKLEPLLPACDILILYALLGRPDGSFDLTTHHVCQAVSLWRKVAYNIILLTLTSPSSEYPRLSELVQKHQIKNIGNKRMGAGNINCMSPFQSISINIDYLTSIQGVPLSILQAMSMVSKSGNVDIWLEDPKQSRRHERLMFEVRELIDLYNYHLPKSMKHDEYLQIILSSGIYDTLKGFDLNKSAQLPLELIRTYISKDDMELNNNQLSMIFWSLCRINEDNDDMAAPTSQTLSTNNHPPNNNESIVTFQTSATHRFRIQTPFNGNTNAYIGQFFTDLNNYLHSMPCIDSNVVVGYLASTLVPSAAYELVSDAMKLDLAAHNPMPTSAILFIGQRMLPMQEILEKLLLKKRISKNSNFLLGVSEDAFCCNYTTPAPVVDEEGSIVQSVDTQNMLTYQQQMDNFINKLRVYIELDMLSKYRELQEIKASDRHYGPAGSDPMSKGSKENFYWQELLYRRLNRLNQLVLNWRDITLDEWANSLYSSRSVRYDKRIQLVIKSISVYHKQYDNLRDIILQQRSNLINLYNTLSSDLHTKIQDITSLCLYHVNFLQRCLRRFEGEYDRLQAISKQCLLDFIHHVGSIKRRAINRVNCAFVKLKNDLETSCNGLILGYTTGYAQEYFNNLMTSTSRWREQLMSLQGTLIVNKEQFMFSKEQIDRDLTLQIMDKVTANRMEYQDFLQEYAAMTNNTLAEFNNIQHAYVLYQKDGNQRLILKIEKAIRECRKIRNAAEQQPLLESEALRDMKTILHNTKYACQQIVKDIKDNCIKQLNTFTPMRTAHRNNLELKKDNFSKKWVVVQDLLLVLIDDYEKEMQKVLSNLHVQALHAVNMYLHNETSYLRKVYASERDLLIKAFRKHFREYDLCEAAIFERFNSEIHAIVEEMGILFGPSKPSFIVNTLAEAQNIVSDSLETSLEDIMRNQYCNNQLNDAYTLQRVEIADTFSFNLKKIFHLLKSLEQRFLFEKQSQLAYIEEMSMTRNGDMVRPQVKAVLDLLISGIEIDNDFHKGYADLVTATEVKSADSVSELTVFVQKYTTPSNTLSIPHTMTLFKQRVGERDYEIQAMQAAADNHMVADHSKLEVIFNSNLADISQWEVLTNQLIENAFHNAEKSYLSHLWPSPTASPTASPRIGRDEDDKYISKYKDMLEGHTMSMASSGTGYATPSVVISPSIKYKGDHRILLDQLSTTEVEDAQHAQAKAMKKADKAAARAQAEAEAAANARAQGVRLPVGKGFDQLNLPKLSTVELQGGWFDCCAPEGYHYFHNPVTGESLWELPAVLRAPLHASSPTASPRDIEIAQAQLMGTAAIRVVDAEYHQLIAEQAAPDPGLLVTDIAAEARAIAGAATDTALDIIAMLRGKTYYQYFNKVGGVVATEDPSAQQLLLGNGEDGDALQMGDIADHTEVDSELADILKDLGLGVPPAEEVDIQHSAPVEIVHDVNSWLALGMGEEDAQTETSSEAPEQMTLYSKQAEHYNASKELAAMQDAEAESIAVENDMENMLCNRLLNLLQQLLTAQAATVEDKQTVIQLMQVVKPINCVAIFADLQVTMTDIDLLIAKTTAAAEAARKYEEVLNKQSLQKRQEAIIEHAEDIAELALFLQQATNGSLSKITSKRIATSLVVQGILTARKWAKLVSRGDYDLASAELGLDPEDRAEIAVALDALVAPAHQQSQAYLHSPTDSYYQPAQSLPLPAQSHYPVHHPAQALDSFFGDLPQIESDYDHPAQADPAQDQYPAQAVLPNHTAYTLTADGYKSFRGGWIEGASDAGEVYYYNIHTGQSAWNLPSLASAEGVPSIEEVDEGAGYDEYPAGGYEQYPSDSYAYPSDGYDQSAGGYEYPTDGYANPSDGYAYPPYSTDGSWAMADALGDTYAPRHKPRAIPTYPVPEAARYAQEQGLARQQTMLKAQDTWQHELVATQHAVTAAKALYLQKRSEIFAKLTARVDSKLEAFVNDIKAMQKMVKKELGEANATERDLRRLFEEDMRIGGSQMGLRAEKLSFILESLEKFKATVSDKYSSAFQQIERFAGDWEMVKAELNQVGDIYDEGIAANLEQCRLAGEHAVKVFAYDQLKQVAHVKAQELGLLRRGLHRHLRSDRKEVQAQRMQQRQIQYEQWLVYEEAKYKLLLQYNGSAGYDESDISNPQFKSSRFIEEELQVLGYVPLSKDEDVLTEEELVMSYLLTQLEMEESLGGDYDSVLAATQKMSKELLKTIGDFDGNEKQGMQEDGSLFNKHREGMERHEQALHITLEKVRQRVQDGYSV